MKNTTLNIFLLLFVIGTPLSGCGPDTSSGKGVNAMIQDADYKLKEQETSSNQKELNSDYEKFVRQADNQILQNERKISEMKCRIEELKNSVKISYQRRIDSLDKENNQLKLMLDTYRKEGSGNWLTFQSEVNRRFIKIEIAFNSAGMNARR
jgi:predicted RNase H-like nuclease (RuvC/YqgF family)